MGLPDWSLNYYVFGTARPKSEDKRNALMAAATRVIVAQGLPSKQAQDVAFQNRVVAETRAFLAPFKT